jgi:hypothetical protein
MRRRFFIGALFTLLTVSLFGSAAKMSSDKSNSFSNPTQNSVEVAKIKAYHDEIDAWAKQHPTAVRYFSAEEAEDGTQHWKAYQTKKELPVLQTHASVWMKDGKVVATILSFKSDHTNSTDGYYYRADGTLAYNESHDYSIGIDPPFMQSKSYYSSNGKQLSSTMLCSVDDKNWATCKADSGWKDSSGDKSKEHYMKSADLPFFNLLAKGQ